ncbi:MAG: FHA domain-containing protein [Anaerolineales bacterium]
MAQYQLIMRTGPTPGAAYALEGDQLTIGRDSTNEIAINDAEVSRRHARLTFQGGKFVLEDLGSTNGTFVNGQRLAGPRVLKAGEVVSFGEQIVLVFEASTFDPAATIASPRASAAVPSVSRPVSAPPPAPSQQYAGNVPASPMMESAPAKKSPVLPIAIGVGVLLFVCVCGGILWYIDNNFLWCTFFPFLGGC